MQTIRELFFAHAGKCSDKWENCLDVCEAELAPYRRRGAPVSLLEIGVQDGGSLEIWQKALPPGSVILGLDVDPRVGDIGFGAGISVLIADASDVSGLGALMQDRSFDIIIDDGSHVSADIVSTFETLFPRLKPGGCYIMEDLCCSYWASFGGGLRHAGAAMEWLKRLIDAVNADYWENAEADDIRLRDVYGAWIERVTFYDGIAAVTKRAEAKARRVRRVVTGSEAHHSNHPFVFAGAYAADPEAYRFGRAFAAAMTRELDRHGIVGPDRPTIPIVE